MRVVLDSNIFVSYFLTQNPTISKIFELIQKRKIILLVSTEIKAEVIKVFQYPKINKFLQPKHFQTLNYLLEEESILVYPQKRISLSKDPKDNIYLECCLEGKANYLITGDKKHLLPLKKFHQTKIISPNKFLKCLNI